MVRSMATLQMLRARRNWTKFTQFPGKLEYQNLAIGRQIKKVQRTIPTPKLMTAAITAYATLRNALFERKTVM